jgi:hypothetical protein
MYYNNSEEHSSSDEVDFFPNSDAYVCISGPRRTEFTSVHQLLACVHDDPHDVFADGNVVHHEVKIPFLNVPGNLTTLSRGEHTSTHSGEEVRVPIDTVIDGSP